MAVTIDELQTIIMSKFPDAKVKITDLVGDGDHYSLEIVDKAFADKTIIAQHRMVKDALSELLKTRLHAITIKTSC
ncbi:MAG: BolA family transcriptional regulator [Rickettsiaceae bacterium]|nr:BolA family transcriptional regulator [Rickettsiaceae bacterium]